MTQYNSLNVKLSIFIHLGLVAADAGIHKQTLGSGTTTLIISNDEIKDIMKIVKTLEDISFLI